MKEDCLISKTSLLTAIVASANMVMVAETNTNVVNDSPSSAKSSLQIVAENDAPQTWNWHIQNTDIVQGYPAFSSKYSGPNSLPSGGETRETVSFDVYAGVRLWRGAEAHIDGLMWQGFGIGNTLGVEGFPNGEAFKVGTAVPNGNIARLFIRQTFALGGDPKNVSDSDLTLAGEQPVPRLTITLGRFSAEDIFDNNSYANDPRTQFMNWALMANAAWDYPADALGYTTGTALELYTPRWALRYGFFQMPGSKNGLTAEDKFLKWPQDNSAGDGEFYHSWGMVAELERRWSLHTHPGTVRLLAFLNEADMGSYQEAVNEPTHPADIEETRTYRFKYGFGLNAEQEIMKNVGIFSRLGWNDGHQEGWAFTDVNYSGSLGVSINGESWRRPDDTFGLAGVLSGISHENQKYLAAGGTDLLDGDGALNYGWEKIAETYYDFKIWKTIHGALDYQFICNPAFNRDRGPVSVLGARFHWEF